ncbi:MAG: sigma-54-dependent Fis family transcriptional regulator, partial [Bacteriovoracaceae bacterium]|nr:sigma-54-dependent Fis family transcriptional regulator [Bacteriovoracaceae bacterium]
GDVSPTMQVKLLRVLQEQTFTPVGSNRDVKVDIRIIAASHKPFEEMIKDGCFREDLFYRLNVLPVYLPPLRERTSDIPHLIDYYINYFNSVHNLNISEVTPEAMKALKAFSWPGNIRELRNVIEHSFIIESSDSISFSSLPENVRRGMEGVVVEDDNHESPIDFKGIKDSVFEEEQSEAVTSEYSFKFATVSENNEIKMDFQIAKDLFEKEFIVQALKNNIGKINRTALKANIPKKTLLRKIEKYGINPKDYY